MTDPQCNRVTPLGDIVPIALRGAWMGNRGIIHRDRDIVRPYASTAWITCVVTYKDWQAAQWQPHHYTVLFFHDEAVALAAGHRPCALCRRGDHTAYRSAIAQATGVAPASAKNLDRQLHAERWNARTKGRRMHRAGWASLPDGTFVLEEGCPVLVLEDRVIPWTAEGYGPARSRPEHGAVAVITPESSVAALRGGYRPQISGPREG